ncbi:MAG: radical SAM protein [Elusimicrobiota bacterium]
MKVATETDFVLRRLEAMMEKGLRKLERLPGPQPLRELHLELTHRCNLRCAMCHHWEMPLRNPASVQREMGLEGIKKLLEGSKLLKGVEVVVVTGGEPWLRPDVDNILEYLSHALPKARLGVLTNFANPKILRRHLDEAQHRSVKNLWLGSSLDGLEKTHDEIRGMPGAFRGLMKSTEMVRREFPGLDFSFNFTITPRNHDELWATYQHVKAMGLWFGAQMVVDHQGFASPEKPEWTEAMLARVEEQIDGVILDLCRDGGAARRLLEAKIGQSLGLWSRILYWRYLKLYARRPERFFKDCLAGRRYAMFNPEGELFFCPVNKHRVIGDASATPFDELWNGKKSESERRFVKSCRCDCWLNCIANPVLDRVLEAGR